MSDNTQAGWHADPTGRHRQRYHDGNQWTEHVESGGVTSTDFEGRRSLAPAAVNTASSPSLADFVRRLGDEPRQRPPVRSAGVLAGFGGAFLAFGVLALIADDADGGTLIAVGAVIVGLALVARLASAVNCHDVARDAATGAGITGVLAFGAGVSDAVGGAGGARLASVLVGGAFFALWALKGFKERPSFFGLGVASTTAFVGSLFIETSSDDYDGDDWLDEYFDALGNFVTRTGIVYLLLGAVLLGLVAWADRKGFAGLGTGLAANAIIAALFGATLLTPELDNSGGTLLVGAVGAAMTTIGVIGGRRATTWIGGTLAAVGTITFLATAFEPSSTTGTAAVAFAAGAILVAAVPVYRLVRASQSGQPPTDQLGPPPG